MSINLEKVGPLLSELQVNMSVWRGAQRGSTSPTVEQAGREDRSTIAMPLACRSAPGGLQDSNVLPERS